MKIVLVSDTHSRHAEIEVPARADVILHAGDFTRRGSRDETLAFLDWLASFDAARVLIGGNHDRWAEREPAEMEAACRARGIEWLLERAIEVRGARLYGAPWTPRFRDMAWNVDRGEAIAAKWAKIPAGLDVLVTHGPPHRVLDRMFLGAHVGCEALRDAVRARAPRLHVFGHIHEAAGETSLGDTHCLNVASSRLLFGVRRAKVVEI